MKKFILLTALILTLGAESSFALQYYSTEGKRRVLVEGFMADWCGYCQRLFAMMQYLDNNYGDDMVQLYYCHKQNSDGLGNEASQFFNINAFPTALIERTSDSYATFDKTELDSIYNTYIKPVASQAGLDFKAAVKIENNAMNFNVIFDENIAARNFKITCLALVDGYTIEHQTNFYYGEESKYSNYVPEMVRYFNQQTNYTEFVDHMAIASSDLAGQPITSSDMTVSVSLPDMKEDISLYRGVVVVTDSDDKVVNVLSIPVTKKSLRIKYYTENEYIYAGSSFTLPVSSEPEDLVNTGLVWISDNEDVATVDSTGLVTAKGEGEVNITVSLASDPDVSASVRFLVVIPRIESLAFMTDNTEVNEGESAQLWIFVTGPENCELYDTIIFSSSDETIATVDQRGVVTGINPGTVRITARSEFSPVISAVTEVRVNERVLPYKVTLPEKKAYRTTVYWLPVEITGDEPFLGLQCDVKIGDGCEFAVDGEKYNVDVNKERAYSHNAVSKVLENGNLRIICTSPTNEIIYPGSGALLYVPVRISADAPEKIKFAVSEIVVSTSESVAEKIKSFEVECPVEDMKSGDLDGDGEINVADVTGVIKVMMNKEHYNLTAEAADFNNDGVVDIMDIVNLVDAILNPNVNARRVAGEEKAADATDTDDSMLTIRNESYGRGENSTLTLAMENPQLYIAAQFDIVLPEHVSFTQTDGNINITLDRNTAPTHTLSAELISDNTCRVVVYSLGNVAFNNAADFVNVEVACDSEVENTATFGIENIRFVSVDRQPVNGNNRYFTLAEKNSSVDEVSADAEVRISRLPGAVRVEGVTEGETVALYSASGMLVSAKIADSAGCVIDMPCKGIYILRAGNAVFKIMAD